jgi:hypothetical protein
MFTQANKNKIYYILYIIKLRTYERILIERSGVQVKLKTSILKVLGSTRTPVI